MEDIIAKQKAEIDELKRKLEHMNEVFANAQRARFGQSSEKNSYVLHNQASFFNEAEKEQAPKAEEPTPDTILVPQHERKKKRSQAEMLNGLPEEEVLLELPEDQLVCGKCGWKMKPIGKKFLRHEMQIIPKQMKLLAYYAVTYACDSCEKDTGFAHIVTVKPPVPLMKHFPGLALDCGIHHDPEVCGWPAPGQAGKDVGQRGDLSQPRDYGKLGDPVRTNLAEAAVQTHEAGASDPFRDPRG